MNRTLPLYARLKQEIIDSIERGDFAPGDQLPSQRELSERFDMSHMTVRRAINELASAGIIYAIPGKGIFVAKQKEIAEVGPLVGFTEDMARRGMTASSRVLAAEIAGAPAMLANVLGVEPDSPLVHLHRLRFADGEPMAIQVAYLPHARCPGLLEHDLEHGSLFATLREVYDLELTSSHGSVEAALATEEQADLLGVTLPAPLLVTEQITYLDTGQAIEFVRSAYRGDRYRMRT